MEIINNTSTLKKNRKKLCNLHSAQYSAVGLYPTAEYSILLLIHDFVHYVHFMCSLFDSSNIAKQDFSHTPNVVCDGSA